MPQDVEITPQNVGPLGDEWTGKAILLVDLDAFFASVEQLDHPGWRGKPVIVGGDAGRRGVVSTASYEARRFGVHSAMPSATAARLCPDAIWTNGHFDRYRAMSEKVMAILRDETPFVQQVSVDEAFMDVSPTRTNTEHPVNIAKRIIERVSALGITCSIGVGCSKAVAKVASDEDKPRGLTVIYPGREASYLAELPTSRMSGIGAVAQERLRSYGIRTLGQVASADLSLLHTVFGKNAEMMRDRCLGIDSDTIAETSEVKSVSHEVSFEHNLSAKNEIEGALGGIASKVARRLRKKGLKGSTVTVKVRYADLRIRSAQMHLEHPTDDEYLISPVACKLICKVWHEGVELRLVGISVGGFEQEEDAQDTLFDPAPYDADAIAPAIEEEEKRTGLIEATDRIRDRFGETAVGYGREQALGEKTTGTAAKNPEDYK